MGNMIIQGENGYSYERGSQLVVSLYSKYGTATILFDLYFLHKFSRELGSSISNPQQFHKLFENKKVSIVIEW